MFLPTMETTRRKATASAIVLAGLLLVSSCVPAFSANINEKGWEFIVEHSEGSRHKVTVWKDGLCIDDGNCLTFFFANRKPEMKLVSDENKTYMNGDLNYIRTHPNAPPLIPSGQQFYVKQLGRMKISGLDTVQYKGFDKRNNAPLFSMWMATNLTTPPVGRAACEIGLMPVMKGFPVRAERYYNGHTLPFLKVVSVKRAQVDLGPIERAKKYSRVTGLFELIFSRGGGKVDQQDIEKIFQQPLR